MRLPKKTGRRGRPAREAGMTMPEFYDYVMPLVHFAQLLEELPRMRGRGRYRRALRETCVLCGIAPRTLERRWAKYKMVARALVPTARLFQKCSADPRMPRYLNLLRQRMARGIGLGEPAPHISILDRRRR